MPSVLVAPSLSFAIHEDGAFELISPWFPFLIVTQELLDKADGRRIRIEHGTLIFACTNGGAAYALSATTHAAVFTARLLRSWGRGAC